MGEKKIFKCKLNRNIFFVAGIILLAFTCLLFANIYFFNSKAILTRSLTKLGTELSEYHVMDKPIETKSRFNVTVTSIDSKYSTVGMDVKMHSDYAKKIVEAETEFSISNVSILESKICVHEDRLFLELPKLLTESLYIDLDTIGQDYNHSAWAEWLGISLPEDLSISLFREEDSEDDFDDADSKYIAELSEVYASMEVEKKETEVLKRSGKNIKCTHLVATIKKEALNELSMLKERDIQFSDDVELDFYLDKKQRVVQMLSDDIIVIEAGRKPLSVDLALEFDEKKEDRFSVSVEKFDIYKDEECILKICGEHTIKAYAEGIYAPEDGLDFMKLAPADMGDYLTDSIKKIEDFFSGL